MTYHIAVGIITADKIILAALHGVDNRVRNLRRLHPGALVKRNSVGGNFHIGFKLLAELLASVSVPEIGYMTVFLSFGNCKLSHFVRNKQL